MEIMGAAITQGWTPKSAIRLSLISPAGERVVGYDNHHPKGDHRHYMGREAEYRYKDPATLIRDFLNDVEQVLSERNTDEG